MVFQFWSQVEGRRIRIDLLEAGLVKIFTSSDKKQKHIFSERSLIFLLLNESPFTEKSMKTRI